MSSTFVYSNIEGLDLSADVYLATGENKGKTLLYIHGGGMVVGERNDLPETYIKMLTDAGYNLITFDYPLAPEVDLPKIREKLEEGISWFLASHESIGITQPDYFIFGRSAGAYLSILLSYYYKSEHQKGIVSFYGYSDLLRKEFNEPNRHYLQFPRATFSQLYDMTSEGILTSASIQERYMLYIHYRQEGCWIDKILPNKSLIREYALSNEMLGTLPPTFLTASDADEDVPFSESERLLNYIPKSVFYPVKGLVHDFDRDDKNPVSIDVYQKLIAWLDSF